MQEIYTVSTLLYSEDYAIIVFLRRERSNMTPSQHDLSFTNFSLKIAYPLYHLHIRKVKR
jgi:hypothetical protein